MPRFQGSVILLQRDSGNIAGFLVNKTSSPVNVTYVYTLTAPSGCTNKQNLVITVNPFKDTTCAISTSIMSDFNSTPIPVGRYIWFNSSLNPRSLKKFKQKSPLTIYVTNSRINFTVNGRQYTLTVPDSRIRFDAAAKNLQAPDSLAIFGKPRCPWILIKMSLWEVYLISFHSVFQAISGM